GVTGLLAPDTAGLAGAVGRVGGLDRHACRRSVQQRFSMARLAEDHVALYEQVLARRAVQFEPSAA
ncbi:MAG: hypothetical protein QOJ23_5818, partial [Actinomycetota bacterium]|nr:hypothetical protein [Actinomycetota bacterium]